MSEHANDVAKQVGDAASIVTVIGTVVDYLPAIAALFSIVWTLIRIYETPTVQSWLTGRREENAE